MRVGLSNWIRPINGWHTGDIDASPILLGACGIGFIWMLALLRAKATTLSMADTLTRWPTQPAW